MTFNNDLPYVFISYAHKDNDMVLPIIRKLQSQGFNVWYDGGIEAGSEWPRIIAENLSKCACMIAFISKAYVVSDNCLRELTYAQNLKKPTLSAFLNIGWDELPLGIDMQLVLNQSIMLEKYPSLDSFGDAICSASFLSCLGVEGAKCESIDSESELPEAAKEASKDENKTNTENETKAPLKKTPLSKALNWILCGFELFYLYFCFSALKTMPSTGGDIFMHTLTKMLLPHLAIVIVGSIIIRTLGAKLTKPQRGDISINCIMFLILDCIIGLIAGLFIMPTEFGFFLNLLVSFLVNFVPGFIVLIPMAYYDYD